MHLFKSHLFFFFNVSSNWWKYFFSFQCVDEWLRVNATCPTCRKSILPSQPNNNISDHSTNNNMINITPGDRAGQRLITLNFDLTGGAGNMNGWKIFLCFLFFSFLYNSITPWSNLKKDRTEHPQICNLFLTYTLMKDCVSKFVWRSWEIIF